MDIYENPPLVPHAVADEVLAVALAGREQVYEPNSVLVGLALYDDDRMLGLLHQ